MKKEYCKMVIWNIPKEKATELLDKLRKENPETTVEVQAQSFGKKI